MKRFLTTVTFLAGSLVFSSAFSETETFRDWALRCPEGSGCFLEQRVFLEGSDETMLLHVSFQKPSASSKIIAMLRVPLSVVLSQGLRLRIDQGAEQTFSFHHCRAKGCIAFVLVTAELRHSLELGREARVTFSTITGQNLGIPLSLFGITQGLRALVSSSKGG